MVSEKFIYPLTMNDYQADTAQFALYRHKVVYPALGLANEAGEVLGKIKKLMRDHEINFGPEQKVSDKDRAQIADELGDVLWYIAALARDLGISMNELAHINVEKLKSRQKRGVIKGSGDNR
jgi:NTP pyrophosphatase (non-canonical NTP hydrolase)